jgi:hypothetical protein
MGLEAALLSCLRIEYKNLLQDQRYKDKRRLIPYGFKVFSQADEDGIVEEIFKRIGTTNRTFVEFGSGNGLINNTHYLLLKGWRGLWIDGSKHKVSAIKKAFSTIIENGQLSVKRAYLTVDNINDVISTFVTGEIDLLSIDLDGNDFHILNAINCIAPRVTVVEYNAGKGPTLDWVMAYNATHIWNETNYFGASLSAFEKLFSYRGYSLVGCSVSGVNAFFVRNEYVNEQLFAAPFSSENHYEPQRRLLYIGVHTAFPPRFGPSTTAEEVASNASSISPDERT